MMQAAKTMLYKIMKVTRTVMWLNGSGYASSIVSFSKFDTFSVPV